MAYGGGPGNVAAVGTNGGFWGLRAYTTALATGTTKALQVTRDNGITSTFDVLIKTDGYVDTAAAVSYAAGNTLKVMSLYQQVGIAGRDLVQTVDANRPTFVIPAGNFPYIHFSGTQWLADAGGTVLSANTFSVAVLIRSIGTTDAAAIWAGSIGRQMIRPNVSGAGTAETRNGADLFYPLSNGTWHTNVIGVDASDNGTVYVDSSSVATGPVGSNSGADNWSVGATGGGALGFTGDITEFTHWNTTALTSGQAATISTQMTDYQAAFGAAAPSSKGFVKFGPFLGIAAAEEWLRRRKGQVRRDEG